MKNTALERWLQMPLLSSPKRPGPDLGRQPFAFRKRSALKMLTSPFWPMWFACMSFLWFLRMKWSHPFHRPLNKISFSTLFNCVFKMSDSLEDVKPNTSERMQRLLCPAVQAVKILGRHWYTSQLGVLPLVWFGPWVIPKTRHAEIRHNILSNVCSNSVLLKV